MSINNEILKRLINIDDIYDFLYLLTDEKVQKIKSMLVLFDDEKTKIIFEVLVNDSIQKIECFNDIKEFRR